MSSQSMPGRTRSSMYSPLPRMKRASSFRFRECPIPPTSRVVVGACETVIGSSPRGGRLGRCRCGRTHLDGRQLDRLDDIHIAGAAAQIAGNAFANLPVGWIGVGSQEPGRLDDHARGAEATLQPVLIPERLLQGVQLCTVGESL